jgi:hypothetical protein
MHVQIVNPRHLGTRFNTSVEKAKDAADNLREILDRLCTLQGDCVGMRVRVGDWIYTVKRDGDTFIFLEECLSKDY